MRHHFHRSHKLGGKTSTPAEVSASSTGENGSATRSHATDTVSDETPQEQSSHTLPRWGRRISRWVKQHWRQSLQFRTVTTTIVLATLLDSFRSIGADCSAYSRQ